MSAPLQVDVCSKSTVNNVQWSLFKSGAGVVSQRRCSEKFREIYKNTGVLKSLFQ